MNHVLFFSFYFLFFDVYFCVNDQELSTIKRNQTLDMLRLLYHFTGHKFYLKIRDKIINLIRRIEIAGIVL